VLGDDVARVLEERLDAFERRLQGLEFEARRRLNAIERRAEELEATQAQGDRAQVDEDAPSSVRIFLPPAPPPADEPQITSEPNPARDRRADHARYMRAWRLRQALRRGAIHT
jgi:hypothetical protein